MCYGACTNCGLCRGESRVTQLGHCFFCDTDNDPSAEYCSSCGKKLPKAPGLAASPQQAVSMSEGASHIDTPSA